MNKQQECHLYIFQISEEDVIIAQKAIELWINDGRQTIAPSSYSHNIPDKHNIQGCNVDKTAAILYKDQIRGKQPLTQINMTRGATSDGPIIIQ